VSPRRRPPPAVQMALFPVVALTEVHPDQANALIVKWDHELGWCDRPFGMQGWVLDIDGEPVSAAISASIVSTTAAGYSQFELVELARQCSPPGNRWANRVMIRLWREACARRWPHWPVKAAVSYQLNANHDGALYRFDGWRKVTETAGADCGPNATWSKKRGPDDPRSGRKTLWVWEW
jgi:hypothetical protein